jgi:hypothetical protein
MFGDSNLQQNVGLDHMQAILSLTCDQGAQRCSVTPCHCVERTLEHRPTHDHIMNTSSKSSKTMKRTISPITRPLLKAAPPEKKKEPERQANDRNPSRTQARYCTDLCCMRAPPTQENLIDIKALFKPPHSQHMLCFPPNESTRPQRFLGVKGTSSSVST